MISKPHRLVYLVHPLHIPVRRNFVPIALHRILDRAFLVCRRARVIFVRHVALQFLLDLVERLTLGLGEEPDDEDDVDDAARGEEPEAHVGAVSLADVGEEFREEEAERPDDEDADRRGFGLDAWGEHFAHYGPG